jgi:uncharacterized protein with HXXEE motif
MAAPAFARAVWCFPVAYVLHVVEELPRFTKWAQAHAAPAFTRSDYLRVHLAGVVLNVVVAAIVSRWPGRIVVTAALALVILPAIFWNVVFHAGASVWSQSYCPGVVTAVALYLPLFFVLARLALAEGLIGPHAFAAALVVAAAIHVLDVGHNVLQRW